VNRWLPAGAAFAAALALIAHVTTPRPPSFDEVRARHRNSDAMLLDRDGGPLHELRVDKRRRVLDWTPLNGISAALQDAVVAAEDRRFYSHHGVDVRALAAAAYQNLRGRKRGASTITMQLAAQLEPSLLGGRRGRTYAQKLRQLRYARALEDRWSKPEILEAYLNLSTTRGELQGVAALSRGLFGKAPHGLDAREAAVLTALLREPDATPKRVGGRAIGIARRQGLTLDETQVEKLALSALSHPPAVTPEADAAPQVARLLLQPKKGAAPQSVRSSLDGRLQRFVARVLRERVADLADQNVSDAAALVVDNRTGEVLAYVGNTGDGSSARFVDGVAARRQAGSSLKPFLYGLAFEKKLITPESLLDDSPLEIFVGRGLYRPENYDHSFHGPVPAKVALASSINIPAIRVLQLVGEDAFVSRLNAFGFGSLRQGDYYGPSLALGTADVTLWELVSAYRALARGGRYSPLTLTPAASAAAEKRSLSAPAAFSIARILSDRENRSSTFGLDSPLSTRYWTAVKTGTSKDMRDNWCVGWSERYTVGVWVGNFAGDSMWNVSGMSGAAPAWLEIMNELHADRTSVAPRAPAGVAPAARAVAVESPRPKLESPVSGTIIALDPDIPEGQQSVPFEADAGSGLRFALNGRPIGSAARPLDWTPEPGHYILSLIDLNGRAVDTTTFEVRGALVAQADEAELVSDDDPSENNE
jgi:penicillin-binding protein 1C